MLNNVKHWIVYGQFWIKLDEIKHLAEERILIEDNCLKITHWSHLTWFEQINIHFIQLKYQNQFLN